MKISKLFFAVCLSIVLTFPAAAEDNKWDKKLDAALEETDQEDRLKQLQKLLEKADEPEQKILANYYIADTHITNQRFGSSIQSLETALALNDEHTPQHFKRRDIIVQNLEQALLNSGQRVKAMKLAGSNVAYNDALLEDMWGRNETAIVHRSTALICPHSLGGMMRTKTSNFAPDGTDVGCFYKVFGEEENLLTIYFTYYGDEFEDLIAAHTSATNMMDRAGSSKGAELIVDAKVEDYGLGHLPEILSTVYLRDSNAGKEYTGAWTTIVEGWVLKTRVTWDESLGSEFGAKHSQEAYTHAANNAQAQIKRCKSAVWPETVESKDGEGSDTGNDLAGFTNLLMEVSNKLTERPLSDCMLRTSEQGNAFIVGHVEGRRVYTIAGPAIDNQVFLESGLGLEEESNVGLGVSYALKSVETDEFGRVLSVSILKSYKTKPGPKAVFEDFVEIYSGRAEGYGRIEFSENGDTNIVINANLIGSDKEN